MSPAAASTRPLAVVTGARRGIGAAIAVGLAAHGFDLALTDIEGAGADETLGAIAGHGARVTLFESDLGHVAGHRALTERIVAWGGPIACLVNNAGIPAALRGDLLDVSTESFDRVLGVNLRGTFFLTQGGGRPHGSRTGGVHALHHHDLLGQRRARFGRTR